MLEQFPSQVRLVFKNYPLSNHPMAYKAALAALAADARGRFWPLHDRLFRNVNRLSDPVLLEIRRELDLVDPGFEELMRNPELAGLVQRDVQEGRRSGVRGTPTVFINGKRFNGPPTPDGLAEAIRQELKGTRP